MKSSKLLLLVFTAAILLAGCKKDGEGSTDPNVLIVGSWRLVQTGSDANGNDKIDPGENNIFPANYLRVDTYSPNKNGRTVVQLPGIFSTTEDFTYASITDNNLKLTISGSVKNNKIITLSSTSLLFYEASTDPHLIFAFTKQ